VSVPPPGRSVPEANALRALSSVSERWCRATMMAGLLLAAGSLAMVTVGGCAYGFRSGQVREGLQTVAVPFFENRTSEPSLDVEFTEAIIAALIADRTLRVVDEDSADALLLGTIRRYRVAEAFFGADRQAEEFELRIEVEVSLVRRDGGEVIVEPRQLQGKGNFYVDDGIEGELLARNEAAEAIVRGILDMVVEPW
jgi:hypothetical protein